MSAAGNQPYDNRVHYKDCSRYNWHNPEDQCDGKRCHHARIADPVRRLLDTEPMDVVDEVEPTATACTAESVVALRQAILSQKQACRYAPPTAQQWAEGYEAALGWVLHRLDGLLLNDGDVSGT